MARSRHLFILFSILTISRSMVSAKALGPEELESLLPPTPRDKNETIAAVVQDPVVQDAVHQAASNGTLNGLVVKKNVYILPATNPNEVLSNSEQLFVVPTENLEDVRRNITEAKREGDVEIAVSSENTFLYEGNAEGYAAEGTENGGHDYVNEVESFSEGNTDQPNPSSEKRKIETEFLEERLSHDATVPEEEPKKVAVPIVAVIDPSNAEKGKVNSPIVAILPNQLNNNAVDGQVRFLKENRGSIEKQAQDYIDQSMVENWKASTPPEVAVISTEETVPVSLSGQEVAKLANERTFLTPVMMPRWEIIAPVFPDNAQYARDTGDMDVAEDIIFRPLFRYRQDSQQRSRYRDEDNGRYYKPYRNYDYYPRRDYYRNQDYDY